MQDHRRRRAQPVGVDPHQHRSRKRRRASLHQSLARAGARLRGAERSLSPTARPQQCAGANEAGHAQPLLRLHARHAEPRLFEKELRSFSHGCIPTGDAIAFATTLLEGVATREVVDAILESRATTTVDIAEPLPVYVTYFTAVDGGDDAERPLQP